MQLNINNQGFSQVVPFKLNKAENFLTHSLFTIACLAFKGF